MTEKMDMMMNIIGQMGSQIMKIDNQQIDIKKRLDDQDEKIEKKF